MELPSLIDPSHDLLPVFHRADILSTKLLARRQQAFKPEEREYARRASKHDATDPRQ